VPDQKCYALMRSNVIYTLRPFRNPFHPKSPFKWRAFRDGSAWRLFKTRKDFERAVAIEPGPPPVGPHADATFRAEAWSTHEGNRLLDMIRGRNEN
jgi:hypothetical protein